MLNLITSRLRSPDTLTVTALSHLEAISLMENDIFDIVILAGHGDLDNVQELLALAKNLAYRPSCIIVEINAERRSILRALNGGCAFFIDSTGEIERIDEIVAFLLNEERELIRRNKIGRIGRALSRVEGMSDNNSLSRRENEILFNMLLGLSNREISAELGISEKTVKNHLWKIYKKYNVENRTQMFHQLLRHCPCMNLTTGSLPRIEEPELEESLT
ncbi:MAG: response regulator transcription factor [Candidatus Krumholzibacteriota bacterium]|nr:response regulator transcription factor [Candidatus Krumholzibacteriota bacterium]